MTTDADKIKTLQQQSAKKKGKKKAAKKTGKKAKKKAKKKASKKTSKKTPAKKASSKKTKKKTPEKQHPHVNSPPENDKMNAPEQHTTTVTVTFQARHYKWLQYMAALEKRDIPSMVEKLIRGAYAMDPTKGGTVNLMTQEQIDALKNS